MTDFVHYLHRKVLLPGRADLASARLRDETPSRQSFFVPDRHVIPKDSVSETITSGDTVWMISQLSMTSTGGTQWLPVSVDAKIIVGAPPQPGAEGLVIAPGRGSCWLHLADFTVVLFELFSRPKRGCPTKLAAEPGEAIGRHFQGVRKLVDGGPLHAWAGRVEASGADFVSYRQVDGTQLAFAFVSKLLAQGRVLFWDHWSLPRRLTERREQVPDAPLDDALLDALRSARCVWGIQSPRYFEPGSYSAKEAETARSLGNYRNAAEDGPS
ncbi:hypothetical protein [Variovorax sp. YR216]|uniref:hypothetical protein n=1 Tax=Variovorax sp. YR216 TaxID=1882828 RepID=UPI000B854F74|nr:hypothetical protein [Variovorax sp. YR216]